MGALAWLGARRMGTTPLAWFRYDRAIGEHGGFVGLPQPRVIAVCRSRTERGLESAGPQVNGEAWHLGMARPFPRRTFLRVETRAPARYGART